VRCALCPSNSAAPLTAAPATAAGDDNQRWAWLQLVARLLLTTDVVIFRVRTLTHPAVWQSALVVLDLAMLVASVFLWLGLNVARATAVLAPLLLIEYWLRFPPVGAGSSDGHRFMFFQSLGLVGGVLLLATYGPGRLRVSKNE
jgi:uncharacterized membrane protein YphA (DoxX/SURF4 family)